MAWIGGSGSGKTVLARALCGAYFESTVFGASGEVRLGRDRLTLPSGPVCSKSLRIGYIPQEPSGAFLTNCVDDEVLLTLAATRRTPHAAAKSKRRWAASSPLSSFGKARPLSLSGGERRLLIMELAILAEPDHLVIDAGLASLGIAFRERARQIIHEWQLGDPNRCITWLVSAKSDLPDSSVPTYLLPTRSTQPLRTPQPVRRPCLSQDTSPLLEFKGVQGGRNQNNEPIVRDVNFSIFPNEVVGLSGANGSGKSTLLRLISGLPPLPKGVIEFNGLSIGSQMWPGVKNGVGYLPQEVELAGPSGIQSPNNSDLKRDAGFVTWCEFFDLDWDGAPDTYWTMSSGERARASLVIQAFEKPTLWLLDEPSIRVPRDLVMEFVRRTTSVDEAATLLVSHDTEMLNEICDRRITISNGRIALA